MATKLVCDIDVPKVVLGIAAHPDDLDFSAAGTIASWSSKGAEIYYLILTNGNKGSADLSADPSALTELRRQEQLSAAKILGVREVFFCDYDDGSLTASAEVKKDIVRVIRRVCPDVVITMDPAMLYDTERGFINHPDHRAAGQAALDAVYPLARDHLSFPELYRDEKLEPHNVASVLLTNFMNQNCFIDISDKFETKIQAIGAHSSQIKSLSGMEEMMKSFCSRLGAQAGVAYAEGFVRIDIQ